MGFYRDGKWQPDATEIAAGEVESYGTVMSSRAKVQAERDKLKAIISELLEALQAASDHLDYCGYGDSWERECAEAAGLPKQIETAIALGEEVPSNG